MCGIAGTIRSSGAAATDESLLGTGVIGSLGVTELVGWVEQTFGVAVDPGDITEQHFDSLRAIARFVAAKGRIQTA